MDKNLKNKQLTVEENTVYGKDYYSNAEAYAQFLVNALGFDLVEKNTGEVEPEE